VGRAILALLVVLVASVARRLGVRTTEFVRFYAIWGAIDFVAIPLALLIAAVIHGQASWPFR
jgi:hypothetical protein